MDDTLLPTWRSRSLSPSRHGNETGGERRGCAPAQPPRRVASTALLALATALLGLLVGGCEESVLPPEDDGRAPVRPRAERPERSDEDEAAEELAALGYVDWAEGEDPTLEDNEGLVAHDPERSAAGYTMIVMLPMARAELVAPDGRTVWSLSDPDDARWTRAEVGPDGDVAVIGHGPEDAGAQTFLARYAPDGSLRWRRPMAVHHDVEWLGPDRIAVLTKADREVPEAQFVDDHVALLDGDGRLLRRHSIHDMLRAPPVGRAFRYRTFLGKGRRDGPLDLLHVNSLEHVRPERLSPPPDDGAILAPGHVLVSVRHQNLIAMLDLDEERVVWAFGPGKLQLQHEATLLPGGNVLAFDNGSARRPFSRVVEIDPRADEIVWEHRAAPPESFYSRGRGTVQGLPGGNVLVASSNQGEVFEVTRTGDVVWRYLAPRFQDRRAVVRAFRYPREAVEPLLGGGE